MTQTRKGLMARSVFSTRKLVHMSMLGFAFLLPFLTWIQAAGAAMLALLFNLFILPSLGADLRKRPDEIVSPARQRREGGKGQKGKWGNSERRIEAILPFPRFPPWHAARPTSLGQEAGANIWTGIILYPISVLALILVYRHSLHVVGAVWAIMALGDGMASVAGQALPSPALPHNPEKTCLGFGAFVLAGTVGAYTLTRWGNPAIPPEDALLVSAATALVGAVVESLPIRLDDNLSVPLVCGGFMFCTLLTEQAAFWSNWPYLKLRIWPAIATNLLLALVALGLRLVTRSGAAVGLVLGVAVYLGYGYKGFLLLLAFFALGSAATRLGYAQKAARGVAERRGGARSWREAVANTLPAAWFALLAITTRHQAAFLLALMAALAEAAGDTVSSEIGQWLSPRAYLITSLRPVPAGENGGVSWGGTTAGLAASAVVVGLGYGLGLCGRSGATLALVAAFAGNLLDSLLGATLEQGGLVTNGIVNFAGTSFAGALALGLSL